MSWPASSEVWRDEYVRCFGADRDDIADLALRVAARMEVEPRIGVLAEYRLELAAVWMVGVMVGVKAALGETDNEE